MPVQRGQGGHYDYALKRPESVDDIAMKQNSCSRGLLVDLGLTEGRSKIKFRDALFE